MELNTNLIHKDKKIKNEIDSKESNNHLIKSLDKNQNNLTPIQGFYKNQCIFLTGGTGFLGKILIEKLLRSCPDISRIYVLVRPKKGKNVEDRIEELLKDPIYQILKKQNLDFHKKIVGIPGDCSTKLLGLSDADKNLLINEVSIVFHVAATVRFDEPLTEATAINIQSTSYVLDMCKKMQNLKSFMHVSTAYANCFSWTIEEKFYDYDVNYEDFLQLQKLSIEININKSTRQIIDSWPNTYTLTKALSEDLIRKNNENLPMGIFRPGIVISTAKEPIVGWIDNLYGPTGVLAAAMSGIMRAMRYDAKKIANMVPVDLTVNALITSAWDVATQFERRGDKMLIYNYTSTVESPITWGRFLENCTHTARQNPPENGLWYFFILTTKFKLLYYLYAFFLHIIPSIIMDLIYKIIGEKPRFKKIYQKMHKLVDVLTFFSTNEWKFTNDNVQNMWQRLNSKDQEIFRFSMQNFDWEAYCMDYVKGVRKFVLRSDSKSLKDNQNKINRLYWNHQLLKILLVSVGCWCLCRLWNMSLIIFL